MDRGDPDPTDEAVEGLLEDLEDLEADVTSTDDRRTLRRTRRVLDRLARPRAFGADDVAQQIVGGFILSAPFIVTEEVWTLAAGMNGFQWAVTLFLVVAIGYGALYRTTSVRDAEIEGEEGLGGVLPYRFVSLLVISFASVTILTVVFGAPDTFDAAPLTTAKAITIGAVFSVVGAATADSLFG